MPAPNSILVIDFPSRLAFHAAFNASYLGILRRAFPDAAITMAADATHIEALQDIAQDIENITWRARPTIYDGRLVEPPFKSNLQNLKDLLKGSVKAGKGVAQLAKSAQADLVIIICPAPLSISGIRFFGLPRTTPVHYVLFGQIKVAQRKKSFRNPIWKVFTFKNDVRLGTRKTDSYILLEKHVENAFIEYVGTDSWTPARTRHLSLIGRYAEHEAHC